VLTVKSALDYAHTTITGGLVARQFCRSPPRTAYRDRWNSEIVNLPS